MLFWTVLALMSAAVAALVVAPLMRPETPLPSTGSEDQRVYRQQLDELDRDRERGLIGDAEAAAARAEIGRRLLSAAGEARPLPTAGRNRLVALITVAAIPALVLPLYLLIGAPDMPDAPLAERRAAAPESIAEMVARVEAHLSTHPDDLQGWRVIAPIYARTGRLDDAVAAWGRLVAVGDNDPAILESYGVGLVDTAGGVVSAEAQAFLARAMAADPERLRARFYHAEGLRQAGKPAAALDEIDDLIRRTPADAPWLDTVRAKRRDILAELGNPTDRPEPATLPPLEATAPGPTEGDVAAAAGMSDTDRKAMIEGMVDQLATRLASEPGDRDGWLRLIRSYVVLGRTDDAKAALVKARAAFAGDAAALATINEAAGTLGIGQ